MRSVCLDEARARVGEPHVATPAFEQGSAGLALEDGHLLGDGRRCHEQRLGSRRERSSRRDLSQNPESGDVKHEVQLTRQVSRRQLFLTFKRTMIRSENNATRRNGRSKEASEMSDSLSKGSVFYGRAAAIMSAVVVLAIAAHLI